MDRLFRADVLRDITAYDAVMLAIGASWIAGWILRAHDRRVWDAGHTAGAAAQRLRDELRAAPGARSEA